MDEESAYIFNEINLCKWDFEYWARRYCTVSSAEGRLVRLNLLPSQKKLLARMAELEEATYPQREGKFALIIAKARRVGATVLAEAAMAHNIMLRSQAKGLVASCEPENSLELFKVLNRIYTHLPKWMQPAMTGKVKGEHFSFDHPMDSDITVGHGRQLNPMGQGVRLDCVHLTEMSTWLKVGTEQVDADILPAFRSSNVPTSFFMIESTGESAMDADAEWFMEQYLMAKRNKGDFRSIFLSWFDRPDMCSLNPEGVTFSETTLAAAARIKRDTGHECTKDQLAWYQLTREQYEEKGNLGTFLREYPSSDDECFQYSLDCAWPIEVIDKVRNECPPIQAIYDVDFRRRKLKGKHDPKTWDQDPNNRVLMFEGPEDGFTYTIGVDVAYGEGGKDSAAVCVTRVGTLKTSDKQVAEFWGSCAPDELASVCWILGHIYTDKETGVPALMAVETNGPGLVTQTELIKLHYPNLYVWRYENRTTGGMSTTYGWRTTPGSRPILTKKLVQIIKDGTMQVSSPYTVEEMKGFVNYGWKSRGGVDGYEYFAHSPTTHDDRLFALAIAYYCSHDYDNMNIADERRKYYESKIAAKSPAAKLHKNFDGTMVRKDYQNSDMDWDTAISDFEERLGL